MNEKRIRVLQSGRKKTGPVLYWMSREQRVHDNWALLTAVELAQKNNTCVLVVFCLQPRFLDAAIRQFGFLLKGLQQVEEGLKQYNIPFFLLSGSPGETIPEFIETHDVSHIICDFDPLRIKRIWKRELAKKITIPFLEVDAHNIIPCLHVSQKEEYAAYTIRPKIHRLLPEFLDDFPVLSPARASAVPPQKPVNWDQVINELTVNRDVPEVNWIVPGEKNAIECLNNFIKHKLSDYSAKRNNPVLDAQSNLSPYLHFGQISAQRITLEINSRLTPNEDTANFLEELIVRRELADNFCYFNPKYDSTEGFQEWAKKSLDAHRYDEREYLYPLSELENANTHDELWNAAQKEMTITGKMHGYLRMYWAKKILEWMPSPEEALASAIYLNDKYQLDGRDANGYTGCAWSIGGIHDRAWAERPVFGKIRYMNYDGCKRKFSIEQYIVKVNNQGLLQPSAL
ncbi:MAG: deoxyribodipyrimidine photo-lyase [Ignavibacteriales bacterium]|nr:deoxyribodipyrimidine photo-lyase [Ignavibacteriales bacterium]